MWLTVSLLTATQTPLSRVLTQSPAELAAGFRSLETPQDVARLLEVPYNRLVYHLWQVNPADKYEVFSIAKRSGGVRRITAPTTSLKLIQKKLSQVLQSVYEPRRSTHGFVAGRSIITNARQHLRRQWVLTLDLKDFFPSINFGRVYGLLQARPYNRNSKVAAVIAQACCHDDELPQGAPTSPVVANMIAAQMDTELQRLARSSSCTYTRYADDLAFSTSEERFPDVLAYRDRSRRDALVVGVALRKIIKSNGFKINWDKVSLRGRHDRQVVTGLKVNERLNVHDSYLGQLRAMLYAWEQHGEQAAERHFLERYDRRHRHPAFGTPAFRDVVWGKLEFLGNVRGRNDAKYRRYAEKYRELAGRRVEDAVWVLESDNSTSTGTGFMLRGVGLVTADHVLAEDTFAFQEASPTDRYPVRALARNADLDLAVVSIEAEGVHALELGEPEELEVGDSLSVLGFSGGWGPGNGLHRYECRIASIGRRTNQDFLRLSTGIYEGMSGGPVVDAAGRVVGVVQEGDSRDRHAPRHHPGAMSILALLHLLPDAGA